jgi:hypothetical protein
LRLEPLAAIQIRTPDSFIISEEDQIVKANINSDNQGSWQNSWTLSGERGGLDAR